MISLKNKYLKYKIKYLNLKLLLGGTKNTNLSQKLSPLDKSSTQIPSASTSASASNHLKYNPPSNIFQSIYRYAKTSQYLYDDKEQFKQLVDNCTNGTTTPYLRDRLELEMEDLMKQINKFMLSSDEINKPLTNEMLNELDYIIIKDDCKYITDDEIKNKNLDSSKWRNKFNENERDDVVNMSPLMFAIWYNLTYLASELLETHDISGKHVCNINYSFKFGNNENYNVSNLLDDLIESKVQKLDDLNKRKKKLDLLIKAQEKDTHKKDTQKKDTQKKEKVEDIIQKIKSEVIIIPAVEKTISNLQTLKEYVEDRLESSMVKNRGVE
jgi:hypothetical protein